MYETTWNTTSFIDQDQESESSWSNEDYQELIPDTTPFLSRFDSVTKRYMLFHLFSTLMLSVTLFSSLFFFVRLWEAWILAAGAGGLMLLLFLYFTIRLYMRLQRPLLYKNIQERYVEACQQGMDTDEPSPRDLTQVAQNCYQFASELEGREYSYYPLPSIFSRLHPYQEMWSLWWHAEDVLMMRELLHLAAIEEHLHWVRQEPTRMEAHTALANRYVTLSRLYAGALERHEGSALSKTLREEYTQKFRIATEQAMQEFHVLNRYTPDDPWIHMQLAYSYKDLQMPEEEMKEHVKVLKLRPDDRNTLLRLATLCFQQKQTARGLQFYQQLRLLGEPRAESLLTLYGTYATHYFY